MRRSKSTRLTDAVWGFFNNLTGSLTTFCHDSLSKIYWCALLWRPSRSFRETKFPDTVTYVGILWDFAPNFKPVSSVFILYSSKFTHFRKNEEGIFYFQVLPTYHIFERLNLVSTLWKLEMLTANRNTKKSWKVSADSVKTRDRPQFNFPGRQFRFRGFF